MINSCRSNLSLFICFYLFLQSANMASTINDRDDDDETRLPKRFSHKQARPTSFGCSACNTERRDDWLNSIKTLVQVFWRRHLTMATNGVCTRQYINLLWFSCQRRTNNGPTVSNLKPETPLSLQQPPMICSPIQLTGQTIVLFCQRPRGCGAEIMLGLAETVPHPPQYPPFQCPFIFRRSSHSRLTVPIYV